MSKGNGTTRSQSWRDKQMKDSKSEELAIDYIKAGHGDSYGEVSLEMMNNWDDMSYEQKIQALEKSGVDGLINMDEFEMNAGTYKEVSRQEMMDRVGEVLENVKDGYSMEDENYYIIGLKGGKQIWSHELYSDDIKGDWKKMSVKGEDGKFHSLQSNNITFIAANSGMSNYSYWVKDEAAKAHLKSLGYDEVKNGKIK